LSISPVRASEVVPGGIVPGYVNKSFKRNLVFIRHQVASIGRVQRTDKSVSVVSVIYWKLKWIRGPVYISVLYVFVVESLKPFKLFGDHQKLVGENRVSLYYFWLGDIIPKGVYFNPSVIRGLHAV
jgi:hypothetical protein